jgi:hypothetical protein
MHKRHAFLPSAAILIALIAVVMLLASPPASHATTFTPTLETSISDQTPGAHADVTYDFQIPAPDANFFDVVSFLPAGFEVAKDADIPDGAIVGELYANVTVGLLNSTCNTSLPSELTMIDATTDLSDLYYQFGYDEGYYDQDGDGLIEWAQHYPGFLTELFPGVQPVLRLYGQVYLAGVWNMVNYLIFEPGADLPFFPEFDESLGYPTIALLNNPYGQILINPISDFCTPFTTINTLYGVSEDNPDVPGDEGGYTLRTNPSDDGTYLATSYVRSLWDSDGDGIENNIDPCKYDPNPEWDPRTSQTAGDNDSDGLPAACDPNDNQYNADEDGDGYVNRLDFCPLDYDFAFDADGDDVGDVCDREPYDASDGGLNHRHSLCTRSEIVIGAGGDPPDEPPCPEGPENPLIHFDPPPSIIAIGKTAHFGVGLRSSPYGFAGPSSVTVAFDVEGANPAAGDCTTDEFGYCDLSYEGAKPGDDTITVSVPDFGFSTTANVSWKEPPPNDLFANAIEVDSLPFTHTTAIYLSGRESDEPYCGGSSYQGSLWYRYTANAGAVLHLTLAGDPTADIGVFTGGSLETLEDVYCSNPGFYESVPQSFFPLDETTHHYFEVTNGTTYYISVETWLATFGDESSEMTITLDTLTGVSVGDLNCDDDVSAIDALLILRLDAGLLVPECETTWADVDCDGDITPIDAFLILFYEAGLIQPGFEIPGCPPIGWIG